MLNKYLQHVVTRYLKPSHRLVFTQMCQEGKSNVHGLFFNHWKHKSTTSLKRYLGHLSGPLLYLCIQQPWFDPCINRFALFRKVCDLHAIPSVVYLLDNHDIYIHTCNKAPMHSAVKAENIVMMCILQGYGATLSARSIHYLCQQRPIALFQLVWSQQELHEIIQACIRPPRPFILKYMLTKRKLKFRTWCNYLQQMGKFKLGYFDCLKNDEWFERAKKLTPQPQWIQAYKEGFLS